MLIALLAFEVSGINYVAFIGFNALLLNPKPTSNS